MDHSKATSGWLIVLSLLWLALIGGAVALAIRAASGPRTPAYYATEQAHEGLVVYAQHCAECHGPALEGPSAPALVGEPFLNGWEGRSVEELFAYVRTKMPLGRGGTLSAEAYAASTAYVLARNGFPGGEAALRVGDARLTELTLAPRFAGHDPELPDVPAAPAETRTPARAPADAGSAAEGVPGGAASPLRVLGTVPVYLAQAQQEQGQRDQDQQDQDQQGQAQQGQPQERPQEGARQDQERQETTGNGQAQNGGAAADGAAVYDRRCASCHGTEGGGGAGPALAGNEALADARAVVEQIVRGGGGMPPFGDALANAEIAAVATHVRTQWGNAFGDVGTGLVAEATGGGDAAGGDGGAGGEGVGGAGMGRPQADPQQDAGQDATAQDESPEGGAGGAAEDEEDAAAEGGEGDPAAELPDEGTVTAGDAAGAAPGPDEGLEEFAAAIYTRHCAACHGGEGGGGIGPALAENPRLGDDAWLVRRILVGANAMPAFGAVLSSEGVAAVATHVRTRWGNDAGAVEAATVEEVAAGLSEGQLNPVAAVDLADAPLGQQRFMQLCASCHGPQGGGDVGPPLAGNANLENLQLVLSTIVNGRGIMPSFNHHTDEEIAAIASYVRTAWSNAFGPVDPVVVDRFRPRSGAAAGSATGGGAPAGDAGGGPDDGPNGGQEGRGASPAGGQGAAEEGADAPAGEGAGSDGANTDDTDTSDEETP